MKTVRATCAHDCPCMCSLLVEVDGDRIVKVSGDPEQPFTDGFACAKVNRDAEVVHSPLRVKTPLRRTGAKGLASSRRSAGRKRSTRSRRAGRRSSPRTGRSPCSATPTPRTRAR